MRRKVELYLCLSTYPEWGSFFCCFFQCCQQQLRSRWALFICSVLCLFNLLAGTIFENIRLPFFLHKLTSTYRQNWSCEKILKSQKQWQSSLIHHTLHNKSRCLNTTRSFLTFKVINPWIFLYFQKVLTMKLWQNTQYTTAILFCFTFTAYWGEYNVIVRDSEPVRLLESPRSPSVYIVIPG